MAMGTMASLRGAMFEAGSVVMSQPALLCGMKPTSKGGLFGVASMADEGAFGRTAPGLAQAFGEGGLKGVYGRGKLWLGIGMQDIAKGDRMGGVLANRAYYETIAGGRGLVGKARGAAAMETVIGRKGMHGPLSEIRRGARGMQRTFGRRRWGTAAAGVGAAIGLGYGVGPGNLVKTGLGYGAGAILGGTLGTAMGRGAGGRRVGGKVGAGIMGLGIVTGII